MADNQANTPVPNNDIATNAKGDTNIVPLGNIYAGETTALPQAAQILFHNTEQINPVTPPEQSQPVNTGGKLWGIGTAFPTKNSYYEYTANLATQKAKAQDPTFGVSTSGVIPAGNGSDAGRFLNTSLGNYTYVEGTNNEERNAQNQSWLAQLRNSLIKGTATAAGTFVNSLLTFPDAIGAIKSGKLSSLYQSPTENSVDTWLDSLENKFPNYYTQWEKDHPLLAAFTPTGAANFWGENIIKNLGFTVGAIGGAVVQDLGIGAITGGAGSFADLPNVVSRTSLALGKLFTLGADAEKVAETLNTAGKAINGLQKFRDAAQYTTALLGSARTEAGFEARQGYNKLYGDLVQEYKDSHNGEGPDEDTLNNIKKQATASANTRFLVNMAILTPSDAIQFDGIFNLFKAETKGLSDVLNLSINERRGIKLAEGSLDNYVENEPPKVLWRYLLGTKKELATGILSEGFFEEGLQNVAQEGTYNYYHSKYYNNNKDTFDDILKSTGYGFAQTLGSTDGWENIIAGALMSMVTAPATRWANKVKDDKLVSTTLEALNSQGLTGSFHQVYATAAAAKQASQDMKKAVQSGDVFTYKNLKHDMFYNFIKSAINSGRFETRIEQLSQLKDLSNDQVRSILQLTDTPENRQIAEGYVDKLIAKANEIRNISTSLNQQFKNPYRYYNNPKTDFQKDQTNKYNTHNEYVDNLGRYISIGRDADQRLSSIKDSWIGTDYSNLSLQTIGDIASDQGLINYSEKYPDLAQDISTYLSHKIANSDPENKDLNEELITLSQKILSREANKPIHKSFVQNLLTQGHDINRLQDLKARAEEAYNFLSTDKGLDHFIAQDEEQRRKSDEFGDTDSLMLPTKFGTTNRAVKVDKGGKYFLISSQETPEGVPLQSAKPIIIDGFDDKNVHYFDNTPGRKSLSFENLRDNHELYTAEELSKTDKGNYYLNHLNQRYKMEMFYNIPNESGEKPTIIQQGLPQGIKGQGKKIVKGNLFYSPSNDKLYFRYWDGKNHKFVSVKSLDQFDATSSSKYKILPDGQLLSTHTQAKIDAAKIKKQKLDNLNEARAEISQAITTQKAELTKVDEQLDELKKSLSTKEDKLSKLLSANEDEVRHINLSTQVKTLNSLNSDIKNIKGQIQTLNDQRNQLDYNLDYLTQVQEALTHEEDINLNDIKEQLTSQISDLNDLISAKTKQINRLNNLVKIAQRAYQSARQIVLDTLSKFNKKFPEFRPEEIKDIINGTSNLYGGEQDIPQDLIGEIDAAIEPLQENEYIKAVKAKTIDSLNSKIKAVQDELNGYLKERAVLQSHLQGIYDRADVIAAQKRAEDTAKANAEFRRRIGFESKGEPRVQTPPSDKAQPTAQTSRKYDEDIFSSTTIYNGPNPPEHVVRYHQFVNNIDHLPNRENVRVLLVTPSNEDSLGLTGFSQSQWDRAKLIDPSLESVSPSDPIKGVISTVFVTKEGINYVFLDNEGKEIGEVGKPVDQSHIVFATLPTAEMYSIGEKGKVARFQKKSQDSKEDEARIQPYLDIYKAQREQIMSSPEGQYYEFQVSRGFPLKTENIKNDVVSAGLIKQTKGDNSELDDNQVILVSKSGSVLHQGRSVGIPIGGLLLSYRGFAQHLNNRNLTTSEAENSYKALKLLARKAVANFQLQQENPGKRVHILDQEILNSLNGLIHFGTPQEGSSPARNQMWIDKGLLHLGRNDVTVPFTEEGIDTMENGIHLVKRFLGEAGEQGIYNSVSSYKLDQGLNIPYNEITGVDLENGTVQYRQWRNYQNYLLSPTYQLEDTTDPDNGKARQESTPLSVNIPTQTEGSYPYNGKYAILSGLPEVKLPAKAETATKSPPPAPTQNQSIITDNETLNNGVISGIPVKYLASKDTDDELGFSIEPNKELDKSTSEFLTSQGKEPTPELIAQYNNIRLVKGLMDKGLVVKTDTGFKLANQNTQEKSVTELLNSISNKEQATRILSQSSLEAIKGKLRGASTGAAKAFKTVFPGFSGNTLDPQAIENFKIWMGENLPHFNVEIVDHLISKLGEDGKAWGKLEGSLVTIFSNAPTITPYHEAFEAVWNYFVPLTQQQAILDEARKQPGSFFDALTASEVKYSDATDEQLKENIADGFADYINKVNKPKSILRKVYDSIVEFFKNIAGVKSKLEKLYGKINTGFYREMRPTEDRLAYQSVPSLSVQVNRDISDEVTSQVLNQVFVQKGSLFDPSKLTSIELYEAIKPKLLGVLGDYYNAVESSTEISQAEKDNIATELGQVYNSIESNWDRIVTSNKEFLKTIGIEFADDGDPNREDRTGSEYDRDHFTIDPIKSASTAIKVLMATITERDKTVDAFGMPIEKPSLIGGGRLVDFGKMFIQTMEGTSNKLDLEEMRNSLVQMGKNNPNAKVLLKRLGGNIKTGAIPYQDLNFDQWRLLISFFNTFSRQKPVAIIQHEREEGTVYSSAASKNDMVKTQLSKWMEGIKAKASEKNSVISYLPSSEIYSINASKIGETRSKSLNSKKRSIEIEFLSKLGINFPQDIINDLTPTQRHKFDESVKFISDKLKSQTEVNLITGRSLNIEGAFNSLARLYVEATNIEPESVFFDEKGHYRQKYVPHNRNSVFVNSFNKVNTLDDLSQSLPQVAGDVFSKNSMLLKPSGSFFRGGKRVQDLQTGYILAHVNDDSGYTWNTTRMSYALRLQTEINQNLNGWYYTISSVDSNTEHMIRFGEFIHKSLIKYGTVSSRELSTFMGYLEDEMNLINEAPIRIKDNRELAKATKDNTPRSATKLRFMQEILSPELQQEVYNHLSQNEQDIPNFIQEHKTEIAQDINKYFQDRVTSLKALMEKEGLLTPTSTGYTWRWLDESALSGNDTTTTENVNNLLKALEVNYVIANIEQHKMFLGDPFQRAEKDSIRRVKTFNSFRQTTLVSTEFDNKANRDFNNNLHPNELGYTSFKPYSNTVTIQDIKAQGQPARYNAPEAIQKILTKEYNTIEVTDGSSIGTLSFFKQFLLKNGVWSPELERLYQDDYAVARYELNQQGKYTYADNSLKAKDKAVYDKFVENGERHNTPATLSVKKPIVSGPKYGSTYLNNVIDKYSVFPMTWALARTNPDMQDLYERMFNSKASDGNSRDYAIFLSGRKAGADVVDDLYKDGTSVTTPFQSDIKVGYDTIGIITEVDYHDNGKITQGTQITNLATIDLSNMGVAANPTVQQKIDRYNNIAKERVNAGFNSLLNKFGVVHYGNGNYDIADKSVIAKLLQNEVFRRQLPDNVKDSLRTEVNPETGEVDFAIPPEASNSYRSIISILMSQVDKSFISTKVNGVAAVQVPVALFGKNGIRQETVNGKTVTVADHLKFYEPTFDKEGNITKVGRAEVMLSSKNIRKYLSSKLSKLSDKDLLKYLNKSPEGKKLLTGVGFRIPTSGLNLMEAFTIKEFLPEIYGDTVVLPAEITKKTSSDFDIDKLNLYLYNTYTDNKGDIKPIQYFKSKVDHNEFYGKVFEDKLDASYERVENNITKLLEVQKALDDNGEGSNEAIAQNMLSTFNAFQKHEKYINALLEGATTDEDIENIMSSLQSRINSLEERKGKLEDEDYQSVAKQEFIEDMYLKSLQNEFFDSTSDLILTPENFTRLITPNEANELTKLRDKLNEIFGIKNSVPSPINRAELSRYRDNNLIGKINVGVYSLSQVYNTMMQGAATTFDPSRIGASSYSPLMKSILQKGPQLKVNRNSEGMLSIGNTLNVKDKYISDYINQCVTGAVDMTKDQFLSELGFVRLRGPIAMAMLREGIDPEQIVWLLHQPIVMDHINMLTKKGSGRLLSDYNIGITLENYMSDPKVTGFNASTLEDNVRKYANNEELTRQEEAEQVNIFKEFLFHAAIAEQLFAFNQGVNYDRANFGDPGLIYTKYKQTDRALNSNLLTGASKVLGNTFLGDIKENLASTRDMLSTILPSENKIVRQFTDSILDEFTKEGQFISLDTQKAISSKVKAALIDYVAQTQGEDPLNKYIKQILVDKDTSAADELFKALANSKSEAFNNLFSILTRTPGKTRNIAFDKKQVDTTASNDITQTFRELRDSVLTNDIYQNIVKAAILQSGIENSPISFTSLIPLEDYKEYLKTAMDNLSSADLTPFKEMFFRNMWRDTDIVPVVKERYIYSKAGEFVGIAPYLNVPFKLRKWFNTQNSGGTLIALSSIYNASDVKYPYLRISTNKPGFNKNQRKRMRKNGDFSYREISLYKQVRQGDVPLTAEGRKANELLYVYKPVNALGDGFYAKEYYTQPQQSVLNNGTTVVQRELNDSDIIENSPIQEPISPTTPVTTPPTFTDSDEGTDQSCPL